MHPPPNVHNSRRIRRSLSDNDLEKGPFYWNTGAQLKLRDQLLKKPNLNIARNVIFFIGDGMSITTLAASRMYMGQQQGRTGEESKLYFEDFPYVGLSKVCTIVKVKK